MLVVSLYDHHFGKLAWRREVGEDYDLAIAERIYANAIEDLLQKSRGYDVERILLPVGQDFVHVSGPKMETDAGTPQDTDGRFPKIMTTAMMALVHAIDRMLLVAPVTVCYVPGNHGGTAEWHAVMFLSAWYRNNPNVTIDAEPMPSKHILYGNTLIGMTHGDGIKPDRLPIMLASLWPEDWAKAKWREMHTGHLHSKKETQYVSCEDYDGVLVRRLPSLTATDAWHFRHGYNSRRAAEAHLYSKDRGPTGYFITTAQETTA
jgi:hypothetical protein